MLFIEGRWSGYIYVGGGCANSNAPTTYYYYRLASSNNKAEFDCCIHPCVVWMRQSFLARLASILTRSSSYIVFRFRGLTVRILSPDHLLYPLPLPCVLTNLVCPSHLLISQQFRRLWNHQLVRSALEPRVYCRVSIGKYFRTVFTAPMLPLGRDITV